MSNWVEPQWWQIDLLCCSHWSALNCCPTICDTYNVKQSYYMITWCIWLMLIWNISIYIIIYISKYLIIYHILSNMLCRMDIHNFPSMPSEPNSTAACRFSSWNIMGHSHSLVEKCWKMLKTLRCIQDSSSGSSGGRKFDISMSLPWNVLKCLEPKRSYDEHLFVFYVFLACFHQKNNEKYIIMRGCWLNFGEVITCNIM